MHGVGDVDARASPRVAGPAEQVADAGRRPGPARRGRSGGSGTPGRARAPRARAAPGTATGRCPRRSGRRARLSGVGDDCLTGSHRTYRMVSCPDGEASDRGSRAALGSGAVTEEAGVAAEPPAERRRDADRTRAEILDVATSEFADHGLRRRAGGRDRGPHPHDQADDLLLLRQQGGPLPGGAGARLRRHPRRSSSSSTSSTSTRRGRCAQLAELTFDHHESHPDFIRLVSIENIHHAEHLRTLAGAGRPRRARRVDVLGGILERGRAAGAVPRRRRRRSTCTW